MMYAEAALSPAAARPACSSRLDERLALVQSRIRVAERIAGRTSGCTRLIAVSKTYPAEMVAAAARLGQMRFGENRVQEAQAKRQEIPGVLDGNGAKLEWHLIGHLQTNKAKLAGDFDWLHSVDSLELARRVSQAALDAGRCCNILIQVNVADDPNKHGLMPEALDAFVASLQRAELRGIALRGLMTIGRADADEAGTRRTFAALRYHCERIQRDAGLVDFNELSMGMSGDYQAAIAEGSTMVRVGSAIFGSRTYAT